MRRCEPWPAGFPASVIWPPTRRPLRAKDSTRSKDAASAPYHVRVPPYRAGLKCIGDLGSFAGAYLGLQSCGIDDEELGQIVRHPELKRLYLDNNPVTDAGLVRLEALKSLEVLNLSGTKVTAAGVTKLQAALPKCKIEWDDPAKPEDA